MRRSRRLSDSPSPAELGGSRDQPGVSLPWHPLPSLGLTPLLSAAPQEPAQGGQDSGDAAQEPLPVAAEQDLLGLGQQAGEAGGHGAGSETPAPLPSQAPQPPSPAAHMEPLKLPTTPGASPAVGCRKQGLFMLQMMPWSQGRVPAEGKALLGKWPVGEGEPGLGGQRGTPGSTYTRAGRWQQAPGSRPPPRFVSAGATPDPPPGLPWVGGPWQAWGVLPAQRVARWGTLTLMLLEGRVGLPHRDQDEEEEEGPQDLDGQLDLGEIHGWGVSLFLPAPRALPSPHARTQRLWAPPPRPSCPLTRCRRR